MLLLQEHGHCAEFHPSGAVVVIGTHSGRSAMSWLRLLLIGCARLPNLLIGRSALLHVSRWFVLDAESKDLVGIHSDGNEQLSVLRFSVGGWSLL